MNDWAIQPAVARLLDKIEPYAARVNAARESLGVTVHVSCVVYAADQMPALGLSRETLQRLVSMGASLDIDIIGVEC